MADVSKIKINNTTYNVKDANAIRIVDGTINNSLPLSTPNFLVHKSPNYSQDETPSGYVFDTALELHDADDNTIGYIQHNVLHNQWYSGMGIGISAVRSVNGSNVYHGLGLAIGPSGERAVTLEAEPWRNALGVSPSPVYATLYEGSISAGTTYTTSSSRKFSDYTILIVCAYGSSSNTVTSIIPVQKFTSSTSYIWWTQGTNDVSNYRVSIKYVSNTQFRVDQKGSTINQIWMYGLKV